MTIGRPSVAVSALESYAAGSGFKARWNHNFYFLIEIESHVSLSYKSLGSI